MFDPLTLARENIRNLRPYSSARREFAGRADVFLDANENPFGSPGDLALNRYPDPLQTKLKDEIGRLSAVDTEQVFVGNGSDEAIDLLLRIFCEPGRDRAMIFPPTYGMYKVSADINAVAVDEVRLTSDFELDLELLDDVYTASTKLIFICSPNNPTGNALRVGDVLTVAARQQAIVVVDEAYVQFADQPSLVSEIDRYPNLVVLQTFSKAWGLAGARVGLAFANTRIVELMNHVKPPYNVSEVSQRVVLNALARSDEIGSWIEQIKSERAQLASALSGFDFVRTVFPSDANFLLVRVDDAEAIYRYLLADGIVVRNRNSVERCDGCLRITIGTPDENQRLLKVLSTYSAPTANTEVAIQSI